MTKKAKSSPENEARERDVEWNEKLTELQYRVLREKATETPFTGFLMNETRPGSYHCAGCGLVLYRSEAKYDSGSGWPSFFEPADSDAIMVDKDRSHGMIRTEIACSKCNGHLGHLFDDGPAPTGMRHCVNSAALHFIPGE